MTLEEQVFAQAQVMAGSLDAQQVHLLETFCRSAAGSLAARLRRGLTPEDCKADFLAAASLHALAALAEVRDGQDPSEIRVGEVTVQKSTGNVAAQCLYNQAEWILAPYTKDRFSFRGI